jgi:hypothetical protein
MVLHLLHVREVSWLFNNTINTEHHTVWQCDWRIRKDLEGSGCGITYILFQGLVWRIIFSETRTRLSSAIILNSDILTYCSLACWMQLVYWKCLLLPCSKQRSVRCSQSICASHLLRYTACYSSCPVYQHWRFETLGSYYFATILGSQVTVH